MATYRTLSARKPRGRGHERREEILTAAEALIGRKGVDISMREIAADAGLSQASLFKHFPTRSALIGALRERVHAKLEDSMGETSTDPGDVRRNLDVILRAHAKLAREQPPIFSLAFPTPGELALRDADAGPGGAAALPGMGRLRDALGRTDEPRALGRELVSLASWFSIYGMALTIALELGQDRGRAEEMIGGCIDLLARQFAQLA